MPTDKHTGSQPVVNVFHGQSGKAQKQLSSFAREPTKPIPDAQLPVLDSSAGLEPLLTDIRGACRQLGVGKTACYELINSGELETIDLYGTKVVMESLKRLVAERRGKKAHNQAKAAARSAEAARRRNARKIGVENLRLGDD